MSELRIVRCPSCEGYGWMQDDFDADARECDWCAGAGYVVRDAQGVDRPIPEADYERLSGELERLETERLREMGYSGQAKKPWEQTVRGDNARKLRGG